MNRVRRLLAVVLLIIPAIVVSAWAADEPGCSTALLITDIQPVWLNAGGYDKADNVPITSKTADIVDQVRPAGVPVIYIVDVMLRGVEPDEAIGAASPPAVLEGDLLYEKRYPDSFFQTSLSDDLRALGVTTVFLTGVASRGCVHDTLPGAIAEGFQAILVEDAHSDSLGGAGSRTERSETGPRVHCDPGFRTGSR